MIAKQWMLASVVSAGILLTVTAQAQVTPVGAGGFRTEINSGDRPTPKAEFRTAEMAKRAVPTNQWYSSIVFTRWSEVIHAVPLTFKATAAGLEIGQPTKKIVPTERKDVEVHYPHVADLVLQATAFKPEAALLAGYGDWSVDMDLASGADALRATILHGSPWVYAQVNRGGVALQLGKDAVVQPWADHPNVLRISLGNKHFAAFAPKGSSWQASGRGWAVADFAALPKQVAIASMPANDVSTLQTYERSAYMRITDTRADFTVDRKAGVLNTTYKVTATALPGHEGTPMQGLYPHHYIDNPVLTQPTLATVDSIRGPIRMVQADQFQTRYRLNGFVPFWPGLAAGEGKDELRSFIKKDARRAQPMMLEIGQGPYWQGKGLQRIANVMRIADQEGMKDVRDDLLAKLKERSEGWLSGKSSFNYFHQDKAFGTITSYPEEYDAVKDMNDHHFHYGYWIRAAADIGLLDPNWIKPEQWGGMIELLVKDIGTAERGRADFPYLRNFDPYEGHAWASGVGTSPDGNNQESSSEAINAWVALMLWGTLTNNPALVDVGTYLYTTEIQAINHYWFDIHGITLPKEYLNVEVSMVFGGKLAHNTWWIDEPRQIHGINLLPFTTASTYLATSPAFVKRNLDALDKEIKIFEGRGKRAKPEDIWQDLFAKYLGLVDAKAGMARWDRYGSYELGDTRTHTYHWLQTMAQMGTPDLTVSADTSYFAVFKTTQGKRSYLVYNHANTPVNVLFSDGKQVQAAAKGLSVH